MKVNETLVTTHYSLLITTHLSCWAERNISQWVRRFNVSTNREILRYAQNDIVNDIIDIVCHVERSETSRSEHEHSTLAPTERFFTAFRMTYTMTLLILSMSCWAERNISQWARRFNVSTNWEILRYAQNDIYNDIIDTQYVMLSEAKHLAVSTNIQR